MWSSVAERNGAICCSTFAVSASVPRAAAYSAAFSGRIPATWLSPSASGGTGQASVTAARQRSGSMAAQASPRRPPPDQATVTDSSKLALAWPPGHPVHCLGRPPRRSEYGNGSCRCWAACWSPLALVVGVRSEPPRRRVSMGGHLRRQHNRVSVRRGPRPAGMTAAGPPPLPVSWWWRLLSGGGWAAFR
jgi:hypothetical protein